MRIDAATIQNWIDRASDYLSERHDLTRLDIRTGRDAWAVADHLDLTWEAYLAGFVDGHIQTALETVFPNAIFKDRKVY